MDLLGGIGGGDSVWKPLSIIKQNNKVLGLYDLIDNFVFKRN
jgi:hypothetical protein